jgi:hypothetical protein
VSAVTGLRIIARPILSGSPSAVGDLFMDCGVFVLATQSHGITIRKIDARPDALDDPVGNAFYSWWWIFFKPCATQVRRST